MEIPQELSNFKETVGSKIGTFYSAVDEIGKKTSELAIVTNQAKDSIDVNYSSKNKDDVLNKMSTVSDILNTINESVNSDLKSILSKSDELLTDIDELEKINQEYNNCYYRMQSASTEEDKEKYASSLGGIESRFNTAKSKANDTLAELKSMDGAFEFIQSFGPNSTMNIGTASAGSFELKEHNTSSKGGNYETASNNGNNEVVRPNKENKEETQNVSNQNTNESVAAPAPQAKAEVVVTNPPVVNNTVVNSSNLNYGTLELRKFTSSKGVTIEYYVYVPDCPDGTDNLPAMLYMHGGSNVGENPDWYKWGLLSLVKDKKLNPSGILICPHVKNFTDKETLKELTDYIVNEYNCDTDRISIAGHSYGGITAYEMVEKYPDYFSCMVPMSGTNPDSINSEAFSNMKVWAFGGSSEGGSSRTSTPTGQNAVQKINSLGGEAYYTVIQGAHHVTNSDTFKQAYLSPDGEMINPLEWAYKQVKS